MIRFTEILGVKITTSSEREILEYLSDRLKHGGKKEDTVVIFTPNPEQLAAASKNPNLRSLLNQAQINLPDGVGLVMASRLLGQPIQARIAGVDFMEKLLSIVSNQAVKSGYFGGQSGVAEAASNCLKEKYPKMSIGYASSAYDKEKMIQSDIDILFVGLGFPKQEKWIMDHKDELNVKIIMAVGGSFDFISGKIPRAPHFIRAIGLEWLFRLIIQPWRFGRQLRLLYFGGLIFKRALGSRLKLTKSLSSK